MDVCLNDNTQFSTVNTAVRGMGKHVLHVTVKDMNGKIGNLLSEHFLL